ncbi:MAG: hypothetical protein NTV54_00030 [Ignavibacteriales bacterium]|nr:hypothetical protein [Ignavibacteriales bacterium]
MNADILGVVMLIILVIMSGVVLWKYLDARHKQRMAMIEKGSDVFYAEGTAARKSPGDQLVVLKWGMLIAFVGIGLFVGRYLQYAWGMDEKAIIASMLTSGGIALVLFYFIAAAKGSKDTK